MRGRLISFDGLGGSGKTTQINKLVTYLVNHGNTISIQKFPDYASDTGQYLKRYLSGGCGNLKDIPSEFVNSMYALDRVVAFRRIEALLETGTTVILDRSLYSGLAYQGASQPDPEAYFEKWISIEQEQAGMRKPDMAFHLSTEPMLALTKIKSRASDGDEGADVHEQEVEFMQKVENNFRSLSEKHGLTRINVMDNNGQMYSVEEVHEEIVRALESIF